MHSPTKRLLGPTTRLLALLIACSAPAAARAEVGNYLRAIRNPQPDVNDQFGASMSAAGRRLLVSKRQDDSQVREGGSAYLMAGKSGVQLAHLYNPTPNKFDTFGVTNVAYGDGFLTGTWRDDNQGAVDTGAIYRVDGKGEILQSYFNPMPHDDDRFGSAVTGAGANVLIGAYKDDTLGNDAGAAYLFNASSGRLVQTFSDPTPSPGDRFGYSVASWRSKVIIGCYRESELAGNSGAVYVFDSLTGALEQSIFNPTPQPADYFGKTVAVVGDRLLVGAPKDDAAGLDAGAAYLFDLNSGSLLETLLDPAPTPGGEFGESLAAVGNDFVVAAPYADRDGLIDVGVAYLYDGATGESLAALANPEPTSYDFFGLSLAGMVDEILIGAHTDDWGAEDTGSVYVFQGRSDDLALVADANGDRQVDGNDFSIWADGFGRFVGEAIASDGDYSNDGLVDGADYTIWAEHFGTMATQAVPEPATLALALAAFCGVAVLTRRSASRS